MQNVERRITLSELEKFVLQDMLDHMHDKTLSTWEERHFREAEFSRTSSAIAKALIKTLANKGVLAELSLANGFDETLAWELTPAGAEIAFFLQKGTSAVQEEWAPLLLEPNPEKLASAVDATERAVERVRGDNEFRTQAPEQQRAIVNTLEGGLALLKRGAATAGQIGAALGSPLAWLMKRFSGTSIDEAAKAAWKAITEAFWP
ncbi:MAG: hypothetical protein JWR00_728 [Rubritepida sp.]|nr:hypothetical protein [Rubritepida sp.]